MAGQFEGKVALVTGAASGIGRASALAFAREGARIVVADLAVDGGEETVRMIESAGGPATFCQTDVSKAADVEKLIEQAVNAYGRLDYAHNNAGVLGRAAPAADCSEEEWDRQIAVNLKGVWLCMRCEIPQMLQQGGGAIVNTSSAAGLVGMQALAPYTASKHGVAGLTKSAALDYAKSKIRINAVCPGFIDTPMVREIEDPKSFPTDVMPAIPRMGKPEDVANAVVWLCSDAASYVTGHLLAVDGAMTAR